MIRVVRSEARFAEALEQLQRTCFPFLAEHELMTAEQFRHHLEVFPDADLVALWRPDDGRHGAAGGAGVGEGSSDEGSSDEQVVGLGSGFLVDFDFAHPQHRFSEVIADGWFDHHDPNGGWYYGADISVHPAYRGRGIGRRLYQARQQLVRRLGRRGIVAGGTLPGYADHRERLSVAEYVDKVVAGELRDPTLSFQLANGFEVRGLLENYIDDAITGGYATLIVWENPDYRG